MKKLNSLLLIVVMIFAVSCQKDEPKPVEESGTLIVDIGLSLQIDEIAKGLKAEVPIGEYRVNIYSTDGSLTQSYETASSMPDSIELAPGDYYIEAYSDNDVPAEFDNPHYYGVSNVFTITSNSLEVVQVTCSLANTIVSVVYSDEIVNNFLDYNTTVSSSLGSLLYISTETRWGYFQTSPLEILVELSYLNTDGSTSVRTLSGTIADPLPARHYQVTVHTTMVNGNASFQLLLDETEIPIEVIDLIDDPTVQPDPDGIAYGELLITEIMPDPSALSDTEGEWFEIYNNSGRTINLQNLVLDRDGTNVHTISDSIDLLPGEYYVLARTATATDALNSYVYGSAITLSNTGAVLSLYNEDTGAGPGAVIFSVDYGEASFPSGSGASISLNPGLMNATDAVLGSSWCLSTTAYNTGDLGTPGVVNDECL
ncbi:MAG: DUF4493 domain-containing protein [Bacteroidales bacterium]